MITLYHKTLIDCNETGHDYPHAIEVQADEERALYLVVLSSNDGSWVVAAFRGRDEALEYAVVQAVEFPDAGDIERRVVFFERMTKKAVVIQ